MQRDSLPTQIWNMLQGCLYTKHFKVIFWLTWIYNLYYFFRQEPLENFLCPLCGIAREDEIHFVPVCSFAR